MANASLKDDRLPNLEAISEYTGDPVRRLRHLIDRHHFPAWKVGGRWESRKSRCDAYYAGPDSANGASK
jgi:hypothetical protein